MRDHTVNNASLFLYSLGRVHLFPEAEFFFTTGADQAGTSIDSVRVFPVAWHAENRRVEVWGIDGQRISERVVPVCELQQYVSPLINANAEEARATTPDPMVPAPKTVAVETRELVAPAPSGQLDLF